MLIQTQQAMNRHLYTKEQSVCHNTYREKPIRILQSFQQPVFCGKHTQHKEWIEITAIQYTEIIRGLGKMTIALYRYHT